MKKTNSNLNFFRRIFFIFFILLNFTLAYPALADLKADVTNQFVTAKESSNLQTTDPREVVSRIVSSALGLLGIIFLVYTIYAGFLWMTAGGEEKKIEEAQAHIKNGSIGLGIILVAYSISLMVTEYLVNATT